MTLPKDVAQLLEQERLREELPADELDAAWKTLAPRLAASPAAGPWWLGRRLWTTLGVAAIAFGGGVAAGRALERREPREPLLVEAQVEKSASKKVEDATVVAPALPSASAPEPAAAVALAQRPRAAPATSALPPAPSSERPPSVLADERALVEGARTALLRSRPSDALVLAEKHESLFPSGELAEDRDFLLASALRDLGRSEEARAKARAFLVRYPASALRESVVALAEGR